LHVRKKNVEERNRKKSSQTIENLKDIEEWITKSCISSFISTSWLHTSQFFYYTHTSSFSLTHFSSFHCSLCLISSPQPAIHPSLSLTIHSHPVHYYRWHTIVQLLVFHVKNGINEWMRIMMLKKEEEVYNALYVGIFQIHKHTLTFSLYDVWKVNYSTLYVQHVKLPKRWIFFFYI